jgi:hypothetical protein
VVLQWQAGGHGAGMGSTRALVGSRGAIFKDVLESVEPGMSPGMSPGLGYCIFGGPDFRGARIKQSVPAAFLFTIPCVCAVCLDATKTTKCETRISLLLLTLANVAALVS